MPRSDTYLLTLIRLLEGTLSVEEGAAVRERLAEDARFREHCKILSDTMNGATPFDDVEAISQVNSETASAFVDGRLSPDEAAEFETRCWRTPAILREIVSAYRSTCSPLNGRDVPLGVRDRMTELIAVECAPPRKNNRSVKANERSTRIPHSDTSSHSRKPAGWKVATVLAAIVTAVVIGTMTYLLTGNNKGDNQEPLADGPRNHSNERRSADGRPRHRNRNRKSHSPDVVPPTPKDNSHQYRPVVAQKPRLETPKRRPSNPVRPTFASIGYSEVLGIVGRRSADSSRWSGVHFTDDSPSVDETVTLRTLPAAWLRAEFSSGLKFVLDSDSEIRISARRLARTKRPAIVISLDIRRGRIAILGMREHDLIRLRNSRNGSEPRWTFRATADSTSIGFLRAQKSPGEVVVWKGGVDLGSRKLRAGLAIRWNGPRSGEPTRISARHAWRLRPQRRLAMRKSIVRRLNRSRDLFQALSATPRGASLKDIVMTTNLGFALDPIASVPAATASKIEVQRVAALRWLMAADDQKPSTALVWRKVMRIAGPSAAKLSLRNWFHAGRNPPRPDVSLLRKLSAGLGPQQSIFVRQSAIHFLRQITRMPLREYKPDRPTTAAIASVRQKTRRAVMNLRRRGRVNRRNR